MGKTKKKLLIVGAGGHAKVVADAVIAQGVYSIEAVIQDVNIPAEGKTLLGYKVSHSSELKVFQAEYFIVAIGENFIRAEQFVKYKKQDYLPANIIHPSAIISPSAKMGEGNVIMAGAIINPEAKIGSNVIINTRVVIEHEVVISDHSQLSPGSIVCGGCSIGKKVYLGANSVIRQCLRIADNSIIGCGASVINNITESGVYVGVPAKIKV
ncbi:acetyltransferase [Fastidiosibacter lacustris]|uniref:acetyltransferase n=1 Tax=Fastidiosibacter lacustris TaxID=2056695 RepID=UPI000E3547F1|nr:acetyltransferase [Fastidiosibacter lacustris]